MEWDQASEGIESTQSQIIGDSRSKDRRVSWSVILAKQYNFIEFHMALDLDIFS